MIVVTVPENSIRIACAGVKPSLPEVLKNAEY
jgi:hypothetical protein